MASIALGDVVLTNLRDVHLQSWFTTHAQRTEVLRVELSEERLKPIIGRRHHEIPDFVLRHKLCPCYTAIDIVLLLRKTGNPVFGVELSKNKAGGAVTLGSVSCAKAAR